MNETPHKHELRVRHEPRCTVLTYGDQTLQLRKNPSVRSLARNARRMIRRHDEQSRTAGDREKKRVALEEERRARSDEARTMVEPSSWYMESDQRMVDLHGEAILEDASRRGWTVGDIKVNGTPLRALGLGHLPNLDAGDTFELRFQAQAAMDLENKRVALERMIREVGS